MFIRGLMGYLPANMLSAIIGVLTILVFTRLLSPSEFGAYALAFSVFSLAHVIFFTWAEAAMARYWAAAHTTEEREALYATLYRSVLVCGAMFIPLAILTCIALPVSTTLKVTIGLALIGVPVRCVMNMVKVALRARGAVAKASLLDMYSTVGVFAFGGAAALAGMGASAIIIGMLLTPLLALPFSLPSEWKALGKGRFSRDKLSQYLAYGFPISLSLGMALVLSATDRVMLGWLMDEAAVGAYHAAYSIANRTLDILFIWLGMAGGPALIMALEKGGRSALQIAAKDQARMLALITIPAAVGVALVARPLSEVVIGQDMRSAATSVTPLIAISGLLSGFLYYYFNQAFILAKRTSLLLWTMVVPAAANIGLNFVLIPRYGVVGAAMASVLGYGCGVVASIIIGRKAISMPVPVKDFALCIGCAGVMALAVLALPVIGGLLELAQDAVVGAAVYGAAALALNAAGARDHARSAVMIIRRRRRAIA